MAPFQYSDYRDANTGSILDLLQQRGAINAEAATRIAGARAAATQQGGAAKAGAIERAAAIPGQIVDDTRQRADRARNQQVLIAGEVGRLAQQANGDPVAFKNGVAELARMGVMPKEMADHIYQRVDSGGPDALKSYALFGQQVKTATPTRVVRTMENGKEVDKIVPDVAGASYEVPPPPTPKPPAPPPVGSFEDYVGRKYGTNPTPEQIEAARTSFNPAPPVKPPAPPAVGSFEDYLARKYGENPTAKQIEDARLSFNPQQPERPPKPADQNKLEQDYRVLLTRAMSSRSGGIGLEDAKVQQANHLLALLDQYRDPKTDEYSVPPAQYAELALGLARMLSGSGTVGIELEREVKQASLKGDIAKMVTYATGTPVTGSTQEIFKNLRDSIERQGSVAQTNREGELGYLRGLAPTELEEARRQSLEATSLNPLRQTKILTNAKGERKLVTSTDGGKTWK